MRLLSGGDGCVDGWRGMGEKTDGETAEQAMASGLVSGGDGCVDGWRGAGEKTDGETAELAMASGLLSRGDGCVDRQERRQMERLLN